MSDTGRLAGRVVVISGGANGAGLAIAKLFGREGARLAIADRDGEAGWRAAGALRQAGFDIIFTKADVAIPEQAEAAVTAALDAYGRIDVLMNHAGIMLVRPFLESSIEDWDRTMDNNAKSAFLMTRLVLPGMLARGYGVIVNTSSSGVKAVTPLESIYCASKAAMHQMTRAIAVEFRDRGIRANTLCPSFVRTRHGIDEISQLRAYGVFASEDDVNVMQGRICEPEEVANVALFLATDASSFINGAEIFVDNTFTAV